MGDTPREVEAAYTAMFAAYTGSERVRMASDMFDAAKVLVQAGLRAENPGITSTELRIQTFVRLYRGDFDRDMHARIIDALRTPTNAEE